MVLLLQKLGRNLKFPSSLHQHRATNYNTFSNHLHAFMSKILDFIAQIMSNPDPPGSGFLSLERFSQCFELINTTNRAFAKLVVETDHPMRHWGSKATEEYLNYTFILLEMLNSINSSVSWLRRARLSSLYSLGTKSPVKISRIISNPVNELRFKRSMLIDKSPVSEEKECLILEALLFCKKIGLMALGIILSGLCSDVRPYMEIRKFSAGGLINDREIIKSLDSKFEKSMMEMEETVKEVKEVNVAMDRLVLAMSCGSTYKEGCNEAKTRLEVLERSVNGIEKEANKLFSQVLAARNELMDNLRMVLN